MDISEEYIKMSDCPEIQGEKIHIIQPYPDGNFYWDKFGKKVRVDSYPGGKDTSVWLPRQDQIQEMMGDLLSKRVEYQQCCYCFIERAYRFADSVFCK